MNLHLSFNNDIWNLRDLVLRPRMLAAAHAGESVYPVYRNFRFASHESLEVLLDRFALESGYAAMRGDAALLVLSDDEILMSVEGTRKAEYCSCSFEVWARTVEAAERARAKIEQLAGPNRMTDPMFSIDWHFLTGKGELHSAYIEEKADDHLLDCAYPEIAEGVDAFIGRYLRADEAILVIQGPPGTGKTRLIRRILGEITKRKGDTARALYTGDTRTAQNDEIFVKFITGWDDAFVIEDADHLLKPRADGNEHLHRFLTIADGVVRAQGRKIIFSTNLPNIRDLDDALVRPGRCFARLNCRELTKPEALRVAAELSGGDSERLQAAQADIEAWEGRSVSLAQVYRMAGTAL